MPKSSLYAWLLLCPLCVASSCAPAIEPSALSPPTCNADGADDLPPCTHFSQLESAAPHSALCKQTQGTWYFALMACACPAETLFTTDEGCQPAPALTRHSPTDTFSPPHGGAPSAPVALQLGTTAVRVDMRRLDGGHHPWLLAPHSAPTLSANVWARLTLLAPTTPFVLTNALEHDMHAVYATWVGSSPDDAGPDLSPWIFSDKRPPSIKKLCTPTLQRLGMQHAPVLCDTAAALQGAIRKRNASQKSPSPWTQLQRQPLPGQPAWTRITAYWRSTTCDAQYVLHQHNDVVLQRHLRISRGGEEFVIFLNPTGAITAMALRPDITAQTEPHYLDPQWNHVPTRQP